MQFVIIDRLIAYPQGYAIAVSIAVDLNLFNVGVMEI